MPHEIRLGELEQHVLWAIVRLRHNAYGVTIQQELERRAGRRLSYGALYATLDRLEEKGCLTSHTGDPTPERGGRAKRFFAVTAPGARALEDSRQSWLRSWWKLKPIAVRGTAT